MIREDRLGKIQKGSVADMMSKQEMIEGNMDEISSRVYKNHDDMKDNKFEIDRLE